MDDRASGMAIELHQSAPSPLELERNTVEPILPAHAGAIPRSVAVIVQAERDRLARMLHDALAQPLFVARLRLSTLTQVTTDIATGDVLRVIDKCLAASAKATRDMMCQLSVPLRHEHGLSAIEAAPLRCASDRQHTSEFSKPSLRAALMSLSRRFLRLYGLSITIDGACLIEPRGNLPAEIVSAINELLMNIVKHAGVTDAQIHLGGNDHWLRIQVNDAGAGFDVNTLTYRATAGGGFGLDSIRKSLVALGGSLEVASAVGQGAKMTILIPAAATHSRAKLIHPSERNLIWAPSC